jgi:integrase/recombinase XerC
MALRLRVPRWHEMNKRETPLAQLAEDFLLAKRSAGCSDKTGSWYRENLRGFPRFLDAEGTAPILKSFSVETVRRYTVHLQERRLKYPGNRLRRAVGEGLSTHTIFGCVATLGVFASWLAQEGYTDGNVLEGMPRPKKRKTVISALSKEEMERLLARIPRHTVLGVRDRAMVITLLDTGVRASELCNLRLEGVHLQDGYLKVLGKGDRERIVPVGANAARVLMRYIQFFRREPARPGLTNVFLSVHGEEMTPGALRLLVQRWGRSAGV